ncbi:MAG: OB-fold nucleic acid binding domain-containing protein [Nanoarchaeota archaeon]|nr:OB-fold nucleic acid binding domain-containing protein [Nanoarchaeota archaeon]
MYKIPLAEIKSKIVSSGKLDSTQLELRIKGKINELSGLISEEGAAHIIANELAIELVNPDKDRLKIKEIYSGMRRISTVGKILRKFDVREFSKGERKGKVCSLLIGDETGTIRVVFWNDQVDQLSSVTENNIIIVKDASVRDNNGSTEIHFGENSSLDINPEGITMDAVRQSLSYQRKTIEMLQPGGETVEIVGTVVQVFDPRFFNVCSQCNKRVNEVVNGNEKQFQCAAHGKVTPSVSYVLNLVLDDGSGNIRAVFWKEQTNKVVSKMETDFLLFKDNPASFEDIKTDLLGEQFKMGGRVQKNEMFDRLEFNVQSVEKARPEEEIARLQQQ